MLAAATVLGFGELGTCVATVLRDHGVPTRIWRRARVRGPDDAGSRAARLGTELHTDLGSAVVGSTLVLSCVPGSASLALATAAAAHVSGGALFVDAASARPEDKRRAAEVLTASGADYVDAAVVGSVAALGPRVPWLVAGPGACRFGEVARALELPTTVLDGPAGHAALVKLLRSVYLKGRDALVTEMCIAAYAHGVLPEVVTSIGGPAEMVPFPDLARRILRATAQHSVRRVEELEAVAEVVGSVGVSPLAIEGALQRLRRLGPGAAAGGEWDAEQLDRARADLDGSVGEGRSGQ